MAFWCITEDGEVKYIINSSTLGNEICKVCDHREISRVEILNIRAEKILIIVYYGVLRAYSINHNTERGSVEKSPWQKIANTSNMIRRDERRILPSSRDLWYRSFVWRCKYRRITLSSRHKIDNTTCLAYQMIWKIRTSAKKENEKEYVEYIVKRMKKLRKHLKIFKFWCKRSAGIWYYIELVSRNFQLRDAIIWCRRRSPYWSVWYCLQWSQTMYTIDSRFLSYPWCPNTIITLCIGSWYPNDWIILRSVVCFYTLYRRFRPLQW